MRERLDAGDLRAAMAGYRDALRAHQERLNRLNVYPVPDGDTGANMALTLESVVAEVAQAAGAGAENMAGAEDMAAVCKAISHGSLMGARGNSGVILSQVMRGLTDRFKEAPSIDGPVAAQALAAASAAAYQAVMRPVEGTILTVVREAAEAAEKAAAEPEAALVAVLDAAAAAGAEALARTPDLLAVLAEAGVVDAGAAGFLLLLDVLLHIVDGRPMPEVEDVGAPASARAPAPAASAHGEEIGDLRYEVMYLLEAADEGIDGFKRAWAEIGDSIVVVGGDGIWNCHVHTNDIGAAVEAGIAAGRPRNVRVTDLLEQVEDEKCLRETAPGTAVVAVGAGAGAAEILRSLGVAAVVAGGQSMNPSTAELLKAIESTSSAEAVVLPNNKNVVAVAERAAAAASKPALVVPTQSLAEGFAALMGFDRGAAAADNARTMAAAADDVSWGEVTWAVRDAVTAAGPVKEGDYLALCGHDIVASDPSLAAAAAKLLDCLVTDDHELLTIVEGEAATPEDTGRIQAWMAERRPGVAMEVLRGDQPLSAYLFSAE